MLRMSRADDERILREMQAPDIEEALEALGFWLERHGKLPFYRRTARAEARRMIGYWQGRVLSDAPRAPTTTEQAQTEPDSLILAQAAAKEPAGQVASTTVMN